MARGIDPPPAPPPLRLLSNSPWYDIPDFVLAQRRRQRYPTPPRSRQEILANLDEGIRRHQGSQPTTEQPHNAANLPALPNVNTRPPQATGQGGGLPPTRIQNPMIQAYLNMLMGARR